MAPPASARRVWLALHVGGMWSTEYSLRGLAPWRYWRYSQGLLTLDSRPSATQRPLTLSTDTTYLTYRAIPVPKMRRDHPMSLFASVRSSAASIFSVVDIGEQTRRAIFRSLQRALCNGHFVSV